MERKLENWSIEKIINLIKLNPATLETEPDTTIKLNIEYQRGCIYSSDKQAAIIESILKNFAIPSIILWKNEDKTYDVIDGKQRLVSIFLFMSGNLQIHYFGGKKYYSGINEDDKEKIKKYELPFIILSGKNEEEHYKHELFEILNISATNLNKWELLQGTYYGEFLNTFKKEIQSKNNVEIQSEFNFRDKQDESKARYPGCYKLLLLHFKNEKEIKKYVEEHRNDSGSHFYNKEIKNILKECSKLPKLKNIDIYYKIMRNIIADSSQYQKYVGNREKILKDLNEFYSENIYNKFSKYEYKNIIDNIFSLSCGNLQLDDKRYFSKKDKEKLFEKYKAKGRIKDGNKIRCPKCSKLFDFGQITMDHVIPYKYGGRTEIGNAQFMCSNCNSSKGAK